jgi:putative glutamine amidotransferase
MVPLIGITCSRLVGGAWGLYSPGHFMDYTFSDYSEAVRACGGAAVILPAAQDRETLEAILGKLDGLVLSGGPDLAPETYGETPLESLGELDPGLDRMELPAARMAFERDLPLLGICRGIQTLNVSQGGTLYQDILRQVEGAINHNPSVDKAVLTQTVLVEKGTRLFRALGRQEIRTNGKHHQAVKDLAPGFLVSARTADGVIEAIEHPEKRFVLGVQWHPEGTWKTDRYSKKLFQALVDAARSR